MDRGLPHSSAWRHQRGDVVGLLLPGHRERDEMSRTSSFRPKGDPEVFFLEFFVLRSGGAGSVVGGSLWRFWPPKHQGQDPWKDEVHTELGGH